MNGNKPDQVYNKTTKMRKTTIEHASGRKNITESGYYRLLISSKTKNDKYDAVKKEIAKLISKVHSASITNGNRLESDYIANPVYNKNEPIYTNVGITHIDQLYYGHFVHLKFYTMDKNIQVDYTLVEIINDTIYIHLFEIKDGGEMDTKKEISEVRTLMSIENMLRHSKSNIYKHVVVNSYIVLWNTDKITKKSFKTPLLGVYLITGKEMCSIIGNMDFDKIANDRTNIGPENLYYIIRQFKSILYKYETIHTQNDSMP
jgi:hypothetical protein